MEKQNVENLFNNISGKYDIANYFISLGIEKYWRRKFSEYISTDASHILDACCGTGISTLNIINKLKDNKFKNKKKKNKKQTNEVVYIFGVDFSEEMLSVARQRFLRNNLKYKSYKNQGNYQADFKIEFKQGDVTDSDFQDNYFDIITIVFGIRNVINRAKALKEFFRITKPGGRLIIMEFNFPQNPLFRKIYSFYMNKILVNIGGFITKNKKAYQYLVETIRKFPSTDEFASLIKSAGWSDVKAEKLSLETCTIFSAVKK
jgi:demethylmenaquinone methyltransferase/2-methoxy-6-polyprenyl-1,4-benzoquinol methylase